MNDWGAAAPWRRRNRQLPENGRETGENDEKRVKTAKNW
jgi:hypothetical protein